MQKSWKDVLQSEWEVPTEMNDLGDYIEELYEMPVDKRTKEYPIWRDLINKAIKEYNELRKDKIYKEVK